MQIRFAPKFCEIFSRSRQNRSKISPKVVLQRNAGSRFYSRMKNSINSKYRKAVENLCECRLEKNKEKSGDGFMHERDFRLGRVKGAQVIWPRWKKSVYTIVKVI